jgi:hypothetical protein
MVWQPGQTGNPNGGRMQTKASKGERLSDLANNYTISALNVIVGIMEDHEVRPGDRLLAARMLLDRAVGTPTQTVDVSSHFTVSLVELLANLPRDGQAARPAVIEHEAPPPPMVAGISLQDAAAAASELEHGRGNEASQAPCRDLEREFLGGDARPAGETAGQVEEEDGELVLRPANDDGTPTQPGGE